MGILGNWVQYKYSTYTVIYPRQTNRVMEFYGWCLEGKSSYVRIETRIPAKSKNRWTSPFPMIFPLHPYCGWLIGIPVTLKKKVTHQCHGPNMSQRCANPLHHHNFLGAFHIRGKGLYPLESIGIHWYPTYHISIDTRISPLCALEICCCEHWNHALAAFASMPGPV
jgi:hypothetical protein